MTRQAYWLTIAAMETLHEKIEKAMEILASILKSGNPEKIFIAWTGGKDSTVVLGLWREMLSAYPGLSLKVLNLDTGVKFPEIVAFRDRLAELWRLELHVASPDIDIDTYPLAVNKLGCCNDLKIRPLKKAVAELGIETLVSGIRADECESRKDRPVFEHRYNPDYVLANPILHWTEMDIWAYVTDNSLPYCELYDRGYRSLGCVPCTAGTDDSALADALSGERAGRSREKERQLAELTSLGYF